MIKKFNSLFQKQPTTQTILDFFRQLSTLITAGLSLMKSLDILLQVNDKNNFYPIIKTLRLEIESGKDLSRCLQRYPQLFDPFCCQLIHIGEQTGTLDRTLQKIARYKEKNLIWSQQLKQALLYPAVILTTALATTGLLLFFVVPQFAILFEHFPNKIPLPTRFLIQLAEMLHWLLPWLSLSILVSLFALFHFRRSSSLRARCQYLIFHLPYLSNFVLKTTLLQFSHTMAIMLTAGLPLTEALRMAAPLSPLEKFRKSILAIRAGVQAGKRLSINLETSALFPPLLIHLVKIGEESGTLERMLEKFAEIYEVQLEQTLHTVKLLLEPLIIAILGVLIGGVVIAMYLPIFRLGTAI